jgi:hypothetical protein
MTAYRAWAMRCRRSSRLGKKLPARSLGMASSGSPAWVVSVFSGARCGRRHGPRCARSSRRRSGQRPRPRSAPAARSARVRVRPPDVVTPAGAIGQTRTGPPHTSVVELAVHYGELPGGPPHAQGAEAPRGCTPRERARAHLNPDRLHHAPAGVGQTRAATPLAPPLPTGEASGPRSGS